MPPPSRRFRVEVGLSPAVAFGFAPRPAFAGTLHVGLRWSSFSIAAEARADAPASASLALLPSATIATFIVGGAVVPCWHAAPIARWPRFLIVPCGVLMAAAVLGRIEGIPTATKSDIDGYVGTGPRLGIELRLGSYLVGRLYGDALVSIKPQQARIGGMEVWHAPPMAGDVGGAVLALF